MTSRVNISIVDDHRDGVRIVSGNVSRPRVPMGKLSAALGFERVALAAALFCEDGAAFHLLYERVANDSWHQYAADVLEVLPKIRDLSQRNDVAATRAEGLFEEEASVVQVEGRTPKQQAQLIGHPALHLGGRHQLRVGSRKEDRLTE
jgi:hypothetical protein